MVIFGAVIVVVTFAILIEVFKLVDMTGQVSALAKNAAGVLRDPILSDDKKEVALQKATLKLFRLFAMLVVGSLLALFLPLAAIWLFSFVGIFDFQAVLKMLQRWDFLLASTILGVFIFLLVRKIRK